MEIGIHDIPDLNLVGGPQLTLWHLEWHTSNSQSTYLRLILPILLSSGYKYMIQNHLAICLTGINYLQMISNKISMKSSARTAPRLAGGRWTMLLIFVVVFCLRSTVAASNISSHQVSRIIYVLSTVSATYHQSCSGTAVGKVHLMTPVIIVEDLGTCRNLKLPNMLPIECLYDFE